MIGSKHSNEAFSCFVAKKSIFEAKALGQMKYQVMQCTVVDGQAPSSHPHQASLDNKTTHVASDCDFLRRIAAHESVTNGPDLTHPGGPNNNNNFTATLV